MKKPVLSVTATGAVCVCWLVAVTVAPGTTPPDASLTRPGQLRPVELGRRRERGQQDAGEHACGTRIQTKAPSHHPPSAPGIRGGHAMAARYALAGASVKERGGFVGLGSTSWRAGFTQEPADHALGVGRRVPYGQAGRPAAAGLRFPRGGRNRYSSVSPAVKRGNSPPIPPYFIPPGNIIGSKGSRMSVKSKRSRSIEAREIAVAREGTRQKCPDAGAVEGQQMDGTRLTRLRIAQRRRRRRAPARREARGCSRS